MAYNERREQGVISGSIDWKGKEYVEIFDRTFKYLYGEVDDLFAIHGAWVEYHVVQAPDNHPKNCYCYAQRVNTEVKQSMAPTTDEFGKRDLNVRHFNKVDFFQYDTGEQRLTYKSSICFNYSKKVYCNQYYGEVIVNMDSYRRLREHYIDELDVMLNLIPSRSYNGGPHWEVTHFINHGKCYSISGYLSIRGFVLRGKGGVVRNRREVAIPTDALRPKNNSLWERAVNSQNTGTGLAAHTPRGFIFSDSSTSSETFTPSPRAVNTGAKPQIGLGVPTERITSSELRSTRGSFSFGTDPIAKGPDIFRSSIHSKNSKIPSTPRDIVPGTSPLRDEFKICSPLPENPVSATASHESPSNSFGMDCSDVDINLNSLRIKETTRFDSGDDDDWWLDDEWDDDVQPLLSPVKRAGLVMPPHRPRQCFK